jgi:hypothetical protein
MYRHNETPVSPQNRIYAVVFEICCQELACFPQEVVPIDFGTGPFHQGPTLEVELAPPQGNTGICKTEAAFPRRPPQSFPQFRAQVGTGKFGAKHCTQLQISTGADQFDNAQKVIIYMNTRGFFVSFAEQGNNSNHC